LNRSRNVKICILRKRQPGKRDKRPRIYQADAVILLITCTTNSINNNNNNHNHNGNNSNNNNNCNTVYTACGIKVEFARRDEPSLAVHRFRVENFTSHYTNQRNILFKRMHIYIYIYLLYKNIHATFPKPKQTRRWFFYFYLTLIMAFRRKPL